VTIGQVIVLQILLPYTAYYADDRVSCYEYEHVPVSCCVGLFSVTPLDEDPMDSPTIQLLARD